MSYRSNQVKLNHPNKVLGVSVTSISGTEYWPFQAGAGDMWWEGSQSAKYYRWDIELEVTEQQHGSHLSREEFEYNGLDVKVGDWIAGATTGQCVKVVSISYKSKDSVHCTVEDWLRYNTFKTTTGNGIFNNGAAIVFTLNENGLPMLDPLPTTAAAAFYPVVMSRFQYLNPQLNYVLEQTNNNFVAGDVISVTTSDGFVKSNALTAHKMIGVVTDAGPGPNHFMVMPNNRIIDFDPSIPGVKGDEVYVDQFGQMSNVQTSTNKVIFLNLREALPSVITGDKGNPIINNGYQVKFNYVNVSFTGADGVGANVTEIAQQINQETSNHKVTATILPYENTIVADSANTIYGLVGGYVPFSAAIDSGSGNTTINFTSEGSVYPTVSTPQDMATDISAQSIANLVVTATETSLTLTELNGNAINITNITNDGGGYGFVGASNISGLSGSTGATNAQKLVLTRNDGGEILIYEGSDLWQTQTGIFSGHTGSVALAMNIEQGVRTGGTTVVADISARDALNPAAGDQAYVINKGDGEWGLYLYTGSDWVEISNQDSATVDAKTLTTSFTMPADGFGTSTTQNLGNISPGRKITSVSVDVISPFTGYTGAILPNVEVGTINDHDIFFDDVSNELTENMTFYQTPEYLYSPTSEQDLIIRARCNHYGATSGNVVVKVTFV